MHNDISLLISGELHLIEQQFTYNPNMPLRMLQYTGQLFEKYIKLNHLDKYSPRLLSLPVPKLVVFYNGIKPMPDEINKAMDEMPQSFVIRDLLIAHRAEVNNMLETEYNEEEVLETARKAAEKYGREQGIEIGEARGADMFAALLRKLTPGSEEFYAALNSTAEERKALYAKYGVESLDLSL